MLLHIANHNQNGKASVQSCDVELEVCVTNGTHAEQKSAGAEVSRDWWLEFSVTSEINRAS